MNDQARLFEAGPDPFGRMWKVQFRWLQVGISIRHADTVDVKFLLTSGSGEPEEKVIALPHPLLLDLTSREGQKLTDPLCMRLAAAHIRHMVETSDDMEKTVITLSAGELTAAARELQNDRQPARA